MREDDAERLVLDLVEAAARGDSRSWLMLLGPHRDHLEPVVEAAVQLLADVAAVHARPDEEITAPVHRAAEMLQGIRRRLGNAAD